MQKIRRILAKFKDSFKNNVHVYLFGTAALFAIVLLVYLGISRNGDPVAPVPTATAAEQVHTVVNSPSGFLPANPPMPDQLELEVMPSTDYIKLLGQIMYKVDDAEINPNTGKTAAVFTGVSSKTEKIYATQLMPEQYQTVLDAYEKKDASLTVSPEGTKVGYGGVSSLYAPNPRTPTAATTPAQSSSSGFPSWITIIIVMIVVLLSFAMFRRYQMMKALRETTSSDPQKEKGANGAELPPATRFHDVAGCEEAVEDLKEIVMFLKDPWRFERVGAKAPSGALLVGPPGTGKTLLARAVAGEAGVPFFSAAGSDFVEMYVGVGAKRIRDLFKRAKNSPNGAIVFIDEIDAVGKKRSASGDRGNQETENTLNALLVEMDGFAQHNIIVIAATNRDDTLDPALVRPGRLDRKVSVGLPDRLGRHKILEVHSKEKPLDSDVDLDLLARRTPGMSGAELAQLVNEACMEAARADRRTVTGEDFSNALATVAMGKARLSAVVTEHDRLITAWHEAGHTVAAMVLPDADDPVSVSIIPRGPAGGVTWMAQGDDLFLTRKRAYARLIVALAGRAAEEIYLDGEFTSGPYGDLTAATNTALAMVTQYGMTDAGLMIRSEGFLSTGSKITDETFEKVEELLAEALNAARATLAEHSELLKSVVDSLLEYDTLTQQQLKELQTGAKHVSIPVPPAPREYRKPARQEAAGTPPVVYVPAPVEEESSIASVKNKKGRRKNPAGRLAGALSVAVQEWRNGSRKAHG